MVRGQARLGRHVGNRLKPHQDEKNLHSEYTIHIGRTQKSWGKDYHTSTWSFRFTVSTLKLKSVIELNVRKRANQLSDRHSNRFVSIAQHYAPLTLIYFTCRSCGSQNLVDLKEWKWKEEYELLWGSYFSLSLVNICFIFRKSSSHQARQQKKQIHLWMSRSCCFYCFCDSMRRLVCQSKLFHHLYANMHFFLPCYSSSLFQLCL